MKAIELMIWDWVKSRTGMNVRVVGINHDYPGVYKPIPLTAEILEKNGFEHNRDCVLELHPELHDEYCVVKAIWLEDGNMYVYIYFIDESNFSQSINVHINYVHELQHALRLCGLNDLADNFKV